MMTIQLNTTEQGLSCGTELFILLYKVVSTYKSWDQTVVCDHSNDL